MNSSQQQGIQITALVVSSFSLLGTLFIIGLFIGYKQLRVFPFRYVFYLSISDLISNVGFMLVADALISGPPSPTTCKFQGFMINFGQLSSIFWTACIAWTLYCSTVKVVYDLEKRTQVLATCISFGIPFIMSMMYKNHTQYVSQLFILSPLVIGLYGPSGGWCWIRNDTREHKFLQLAMIGIQFYIPLWLAFVFNGVTIYRVIKYVKGITQDKKQLSLVNRLALYPLILLVCWSAGTVHRLFDFFGIESHFLAYLHVLLGGLQGLFNAIIYGLNSNVRKIIRQHLLSRFPCFTQALENYKEHKNLSDIEESSKEQHKKTQSLSQGEANIEMESLNR